MKSLEELYQDIQTIFSNGWEKAGQYALEQLLESHPQFAQGHHDLGVLYYKAGEKEKSLEQFKRAVENDPENVDFLKDLADLYYVELQQTEHALTLYKQILDKRPQDSDTLFIAGNLSVASHEFEDAINFYQKLLEIEPWHSEALETLEKLKHHLKKQAQKDPETLYQQAQQLAGDDKLEAAIGALEELIRFDPEYAQAYNDLGVLYHRLGVVEQVLKNYQRAIDLEPHNKIFQKNLADFYYVEQGSVTDALEIYLNMLKSDPEDIEVLMAAGHISIDLNRPEDAEIFYNRVLEIEPWNLEASQYLENLKAELKAKNVSGM